MWYVKRTHMQRLRLLLVKRKTHAMTLVDPLLDCEKRTHAMTLVDPYVVCEKNTHAMTPIVVSKKNRHAITLVDPCVVSEDNTHFNDTSGSIGGLRKEHTCNDTGGSMCGM